MFKPLLFFLFLCLFQSVKAQKYALVIHGGAGDIDEKNLTNADEYRSSLDSALTIGENILKKGGSSLDAVENVIKYFEDNPLYNAGRGAVLTDKGTVELDASIMDGKAFLAGAVAGVTDIKHPISAARLVMEKTQHVMLISSGASAFAKEQGLEMVPNSYFITPERKASFEKMKKENIHGTVGCVALDKNGNLAAGTSTGGMMLKKYGRVGDSPIIGAGTYASNATCAVSCTGYGEYFIRNSVAFHVNALMLYKRLSVKNAVSFVIDSVLTPQHGTGGIIALDNKGNYTWDFNTTGMFRGVASSDGTHIVQLFGK